MTLSQEKQHYASYNHRSSFSNAKAQTPYPTHASECLINLLSIIDHKTILIAQ